MPVTVMLIVLYPTMNWKTFLESLSASEKGSENTERSRLELSNIQVCI